jgi:transposase-like protein
MGQAATARPRPHSGTLKDDHLRRLSAAGPLPHLWRAVDQDGIVLDILVQSRRDKQAAKRLLRKLLKKQRRPPRVMITDLIGLQSKTASASR